MKEFLSRLRRGDGVLDVGANVGSMSQLMADAVGAQGYVLAIEPNTATADTLRERLKSYPQVTCMRVAVTDQLGTATLYHDSESKRDSLWPENTLSRAKGSDSVHTVTLDYLAGIVLNLHGIKLDTQGAECLALAGGQQCLANPHLIWYVEVWPAGLLHAGGSVSQLVDAFAEKGWRCLEYPLWSRVVEAAKGKKGHGSFDITVVHD